MTQPRLRAYFFDANGKVLPVGTLLRNPAYARTLRAIAAGGADAFYTGEIARDIVGTVTGHPFNPGDVTLADLANYAVVVREPVCDTVSRATASAAFRCRRRAASPCCRC